MADMVQVLMEKMIPELEDLQEKKLFSKEEIHQIVEKRRDFEYMMKRIPLRKIDGLRYIEYELNLEALRQKRKERLGLKKHSLSDTTGTKRVHSIFDRTIYKHRGSVDLWLQYVAYCKNEGAGRVLSHVFSRALQAHPRRPEIWIEAASYEFSTNLSIESARVLMQRAIRINKQCQRLWHEYFRLELLYIQKLAVRREILKLDDPTTASTSGSVSLSIDELPEEQADKSSSLELNTDVSDKKKARGMILQGAIPRLIFQNAIETIADDVAFRLQFVAISDLFGARFASDLSGFILESCLKDFTSNEEVHAVQALRPFIVASEDDAQAEAEAIKLFESSVAQLQTISMKERFALWLIERLASPFKTTSLVDYAQKTLKQLATESASSRIATQFIDLVHRTEGTAAAVKTAKAFVNGSFAKSAELWLVYAQLVCYVVEENHATPSPKRRRTSETKATTKTSPVDESIAILKSALNSLASDDQDGHYIVTERLLELLIGSGSSSNEAIERVFKDAMGVQARDCEHWNTLRLRLLSWSASVYSVEAVRAQYQRFLSGPLLPTEATYDFLLCCVEIEVSVAATNVAVAPVRMLFEKLVDLFGQTSEDAWIEYIRFFTSHAQYADATRVHQRAMRQWKDSPRLAQLVLTGSNA